MAQRTYTFDKRLGRFRDPQGRIVSRERALRSSVARAQYQAAQKPARVRKRAPAPAPKAKPAPAPKAKPARAKAPAKARATFRYDPRTDRFYDSHGKRISRERGLRSTVARAQFTAAVESRKRKPTKRRPPRPRRHKVMIAEMAQAPGQFMVENIGQLSAADLAEMLFTQFTAGFQRFRFWYKMAKKSADYPNAVASTLPYHWSIVVGVIPSLEHTINFVQGKTGRLFGKIFQYWISKR